MVCDPCWASLACASLSLVSGPKLAPISQGEYRSVAQKTVHLVSIAAPFRAGVADMTRPPSALLYVGGYLKRHGFSVKVHHIQEHQIDETIEDHLTGDDVLFVGFSIITGKPVTMSASMSRRIRVRNPRVPIVWGGIHPSLMPKESLDGGLPDYVVIGEGEHTILELAQFLDGTSAHGLDEIAGLGFRRDGVTVLTARREFQRNMDEFRQDWSLVDIQQYVRKLGPRRAMCFITSRGCPHSCGFCYNQAFNERRWRCHSADFVVRELLEIKRLTGITSVNFDDDNFFTDRKRGLEIIRRLKENGITCQWVELRVDYIQEALLKELVELGVESIFMGWESGSAKTLSRIAKGFTPDLILEKVKLLAKFPSLSVDASAIVGFPWETEKDIEDTISLALRMFRAHPFHLNFNIGIYVPYPGSPILTEAHLKGFRFPTEDSAWSRFDIIEGKMELPWMPQSNVRRITLIDKYAKLLFGLPKPWPFPLRAISRVLAVVAYVRLKTRLLWCPFEVWLYLTAGKYFLERRSQQAAAH